MVKSRSLTTAQCRLVNPYVQPVLYIRRPGSDIEEMHRFPDDDPFFSEVSSDQDSSDQMLTTSKRPRSPFLSTTLRTSRRTLRRHRS